MSANLKKCQVGEVDKNNNADDSSISGSGTNNIVSDVNTCTSPKPRSTTTSSVKSRPGQLNLAAETFYCNVSEPQRGVKRPNTESCGYSGPDSKKLKSGLDLNDDLLKVKDPLIPVQGMVLKRLGLTSVHIDHCVRLLGFYRLQVYNFILMCNVF